VGVCAVTETTTVINPKKAARNIFLIASILPNLGCPKSRRGSPSGGTAQINFSLRVSALLVRLFSELRFCSALFRAFRVIGGLACKITTEYAENTEKTLNKKSENQ
jgi:hypothetical protein